ncbi:sigma-54 dependent transcriptional regulator, partial [Rhodospirillales bacterium]|nr:sigma-54 dependent transcriptional regulator [Rhodospirillales bacterium]
MQLLIVGTLEGQIGAASQIAIKRGAKVQQADTIDQGLDLLRRAGADLVMIDVSLEVDTFMDALELERINVPVVACGVSNDTQAAVRAVRAGAQEYIPLPPDADLIAAVLEAVTNQQHALIFKDQKMADVVKMADQIAASEASILVTGPSGTGKEVLAHYIHNKSKRKDRRFVAVNCAAIPENLLESELFGHEKGAFTGAVARRIGKFEEADGGTLLLDEISEMDVRLQAKLLRVLQEREVDRIGSNKPVPVNVRIIATSNRIMEEAVQQGHFREDLYFRLNVVNIRLPALAERPADITLLAEHFAIKYAEANDVPRKPLGDDAIQKLQSYTWPGNVRELEN